jgi:hypothetical protein
MIIALISYGSIILATKLKIRTKSERLPYFAIAIILIIVPAELLRFYPIEREEIKQAINYMQKNISEEQAIYIYPMAERAFNYYEQINFINVDNEQIRGSNRVNDRGVQLQQLDGMSGQVWFLFSHVNPYFKRLSEEDYFIGFLEKDWTLIDKYEARGSSVYLFERKSL